MLKNRTFLPSAHKVMARFANYELTVLLIACFIFGGTSQDIVAPKLIIYLLSLFVIGRRTLFIQYDSKLRTLKPVLLLFGALFLMSALQLVPIPYSLWSSFPGRSEIVNGYELAGLAPSWLPLSMTPEKTLFSLFDFLPPLAVILILGTRQSYSEIKNALITIAVFVVISVILANLQYLNLNEGLYFYTFTNRNVGVGFFSNANHFGIFLILSLPFLALLFSTTRKETNGTLSSIQIICLIAAVLAAFGVGMTGSLASYFLLAPVAFVLLYVMVSEGRVKRRTLIIIIVLVTAFTVSQIFIFRVLGGSFLHTLQNLGEDNRHIFRATTLEATRDLFPMGSGLGSFADVYRLFEGFDEKTIPHAHNEYLEIIVEFGALGVIWLTAFLAYITHHIWKAFFVVNARNKISRYMAIVVAALMIHSTVDYAPRTIAITALTIFALCLMIAPPRRLEQS